MKPLDPELLALIAAERAAQPASADDPALAWLFRLVEDEAEPYRTVLGDDALEDLVLVAFGAAAADPELLRAVRARVAQTGGGSHEQLRAEVGTRVADARKKLGGG